MTDEEFDKLWEEIKEHDRIWEEKAKKHPVDKDDPFRDSPMFQRWAAEDEDHDGVWP